MTSKEYNNKKRECWEDFCRKFLPEADSEATMKDVIDFAFDRAYSLGRQEIKQEKDIIIKKQKDELYSVETESQIARNLMWHEMLMLIARMTEPQGPECLVWLEDKNLFTSENQ